MLGNNLVTLNKINIMAQTDYLAKYAEKAKIEALQDGGQAPAGGGGQDQITQLMQAYLQAKQSGDQQAICQAAVDFIEFVEQQIEAQQGGQGGAQGVPARMVGGKIRFDKNGNLV